MMSERKIFDVDKYKKLIKVQISSFSHNGYCSSSLCSKKFNNVEIKILTMRWERPCGKIFHSLSSLFVHATFVTSRYYFKPYLIQEGTLQIKISKVLPKIIESQGHISHFIKLLVTQTFFLWLITINGDFFLDAELFPNDSSKPFDTICRKHNISCLFCSLFLELSSSPRLIKC